MYLLRLTRRVINLEFLIQAEDLDTGPPARVRLTLASGTVLDVTGTDADRVHDRLSVLAPEVAPGPLMGGTGLPIDPETGHPLGPPAGQ
jgi:hypothetical protein